MYSHYRSTHVGPRKGAASRQAHAARYEEWDHLIGPFLPTDLSASIIDVGCGSGSIVQWLLDRGYAKTSGIDGSDEEVTTAKNLGLPISHGWGHDVLGANPNRFDLIILRNILEHLNKGEVLALLDSAYAALRPGGKIWVQVPNAEALFGSRVRYADFTHELAFTQVSLAQVFRVVGFEGFIFQGIEPVQPSIWRRLRWQLAKSLYLSALQAELGHKDFILTQDVLGVASKPTTSASVP